MIKYQGSKQRYLGAIKRTLLGLPRYHHLPFAEICCGTAVVSAYLCKKTTLADWGPWGAYWSAIKRVDKEQLLKELKDLDVHDRYDYAAWIKHILYQPVPQDDTSFILSFLALQREAFNGKPINISGGHWRTPGLGKIISSKPFYSGITRSLDLKPYIQDVIVSNASYIKFDDPHIIYIDPDYEGTTGYSDYRFDVEKFVSNNTNSHIVVSHDKPIEGVKWDDIVDISIGWRGPYTKSDAELLHIKEAC